LARLNCNIITWKKENIFDIEKTGQKEVEALNRKNRWRII